MDVKDLLKEPTFFDWSGDLRVPVRSAAMVMSCDAWWSRTCGDFKGKVSKENDFRLVWEDEEGVSNVRVFDNVKPTADLEVLDVGTVTKVETGGVWEVEEETFSSLPSVGVARIGTMTSLTLDPLNLVKPAKLRALPPSHPLLLDGRALRLTEELLPAVGQSETLRFLLKAKEDDFRLVWEDEEGVSNVRVFDSDKPTADLEVLEVGTVTKVDTGGVCESSSLLWVGVARIGTMTSLTLDPLELIEPAKVKLCAPSPSHPLLLDGRALQGTEGEVGESERLSPEGSLGPMM